MPPADQIKALTRLQAGLTSVLIVVAVVALAFTATNVTLFAISHRVSPWIAWLLDPMVAVALGAVLIVDGRLLEYGVQPSGWASGLRWFAGMGTWVMNCWDSLWPEGTVFGVPHAVDPAGLVLHSVPPVLLIVLAEAITHYRRSILDKVTELRALVNARGTTVDVAPVHPASIPEPAPTPAPVGAPAAVVPSRRSSLVICGGRAVHALAVPPVSTDGSDDEPGTEKLSASEALNVIRACWVMRRTIAEAARESTRSTSYVHKVYKRLDEQRATAPNALSAAVADAREAAAV
ncbi:hypothetical protein EKH77_17450 [Streptomyces luteoverticillatus]|uniref:Uncharacterized protein n=1 Tax=Streptomyces luteoverticillatus TaxID=66425 RepID=A0A3Q9G0H9_STRLT|nr:hypothetical protein [Streptomyces luteoverticillatus]AZQ72769.1 hypothetical protein EKH77_17450 [Streptomyces luteoverticillatus]